MAVKKMRLDFSKVTERSGWNTSHMEEGLHLMKIVDVSDAPASDGGDMLTYALVPVEEKYKARRFPYFCKIQDNQLFKIRDLLVATGSKVPAKAGNIDPNSPVGSIVAAEVQDGRGQYSDRSEINGIYAASIIEDDDATSDEPEEDEEAEDEEYETEEGDEEEGEEEAELREELEGLTLPALRKRAKGLGIATPGIKAEDLIELVIESELEEADEEDEEDEEDLGDEELEEEEFEEDEDEEEEEPVKPARKAAARKPAAKPAAKAAPAKRVVKRR